MMLPIDGDKLYQQRARAAFPILVRQALSKETIYYGMLAEELGMANPRNLNDVLGAIGRTIEVLRPQIGSIPPIQFLVVQKRSGVPSVGISAYVSSIPDFKRLTLLEKRWLAEQKNVEISAYPYWHRVLAAAGLEAPSPVLSKEPLQIAGTYGFGDLRVRHIKN